MDRCFTMDLHQYIIQKCHNFNHELDTRWHGLPQDYKALQTLLFFQAFTTIDLIERFKINIVDNPALSSLSYYYLCIEKYIRIPAIVLYPASFHRPYAHILLLFEKLSQQENTQKFDQQLSEVRQWVEKISIPQNSLSMYEHLYAALKLSLNLLEDQQIEKKHKLKLIAQWQKINNLEQPAAYYALDKIRGYLNKYQQQSLAQYFLRLIAENENNHVEFKQRTTDLLSNKKSDKWLKACFAFMNTRAGHVMIGVADNQVIVGVENEVQQHFHGSLDLMKRSLMDKLAHESQHYSSLYTVLEDVKIGDKTILVFKCYKADRPVYYQGELYMRNNGQTIRVPPALIPPFQQLFYGFEQKFPQKNTYLPLNSLCD